MSFQLNISNKLNSFIDLVELKATSVFQPNYFVYQNSGIKDLLTTELTKKYGVIANVKFIGFNELAVDIANVLGFKASASGQMDWLWAVYSNLGSKVYTDAFPEIYKYYQTDYYKRIQLAEQLADLFEHYMVYRGKMVAKWRNGDLSTDSEVELWQRDLYLMCLKSLDAENVNRVDIKENIVDALSQEGANNSWLKKQFPLIQVYGVDVLLPSDYKLLAVLGKFTEVRLYMFNPSPGTYWYDCISNKDAVRRKFKGNDDEVSQGNDLLISNGKMGRDMFSFMFDTYPEILNTTYEDVIDSKPHLLGILQNDILNNSTGEDRNPISDLTDGSLSIVGNYTEAREIEVLLDFILKSLEDDKDLQLHDVLVMAPNIEKYEPYIHAVFSSSKLTSHLKYTISDLPFSSTEDLVKLLLQTFQIRADEINLETIIQFLENPLVKAKYQLYTIDKIHHALSKTCFVFGEKGEKEAETNLISWEQSKKQLMYGVVMKDGLIEMDGFDVEPYSESEGSNVQELIRLVAFVDSLFVYAKENTKRKSIIEWGDLFLNRVENFWREDLISNESLHLIQDSIELIDRTSSSVSDKFNATTYAYLITKKLTATEIIPEKQGGKIMFCNMQSMKGIEHKVIAVLGLNETDFPRIPTKLSFDLMALAPQKADRSLKENDKYLFLEALMSATDKLFCSYISHRAKDNKSLNPSIVLQELVDYLNEKVDTSSFIQHHPKEKDSLLYYLEGSSFYSFSPESTNNSPYKPILKPTNTTAEEDVYIDWLDFEKYFKHPQKWYARNVLGAYLDEKHYEIAASESFGDYEPGLEQYILKNSVYEGTTELQLKRERVLPLHNFGKVVLDDTNEGLRQLKEQMTLHQVMCREEQLDQLSLKIDDVTFSLEGMTLLKEKDSENYRLIQTSLAKASSTGKYLFSLWLRYLFLRALGYNVTAYLETLEEDDKKLIECDTVSLEGAKQQIEKMVAVYKNRREGFIGFHPNTIYKLKESSESPEFKEKLDKIVQGGGGYDADLNFSFRDDTSRVVWNETNVKNMIENIWPV